MRPAAVTPDLAEVQRLLNHWLNACYPAWRNACLRADVGEQEPLTLPIPRQLLTEASRAAARFIPTPLQVAILEALDGKGLRTDALARACEVDRRRLFKPGGIKELMERGGIEHHTRIGYYRPDAPPQELVPEQA